jgi:hypothetical protein
VASRRPARATRTPTTATTASRQGPPLSSPRRPLQKGVGWNKVGWPSGVIPLAARREGGPAASTGRLATSNRWSATRNARGGPLEGLIEPERLAWSEFSSRRFCARYLGSGARAHVDGHTAAVTNAIAPAGPSVHTPRNRVTGLQVGATVGCEFEGGVCVSHAHAARPRHLA